MKYDVGIVLAQELVENNGLYKLSGQTKSRTDLGIKSYKSGQVKKLIMSGGHENFGKNYKISLAEVMKQYAVEQGVPEKDILKEDLSLETAGQLIFCKTGIIKPKNWESVLIISNEWHLERVRKEAEFIFGEDYSLDYQGSLWFQTKRTPKQEQKSYETFLHTFQGINPGDNQTILNRLFEKHPSYNKNPKDFKTRLEKLMDASKQLL